MNKRTLDGYIGLNGDHEHDRTAGQVMPEPLRVALYSHDTQGLGHIRRNLLIAKALGCRNGATPIILLLSGVREAAAFALPAGVDCLTLPSLSKDSNGDYQPRSLSMSMPDLISIRTNTITAALRSFEPDLFIVDKVPTGALNELLPTLEMLRQNGRTRIVLGLREILDDVITVRREWESGAYTEILRKYYHRIGVYGDRRVFDTAVEYGFPADLARMVRYTGYLNPRDAGPEHATSTNSDAPVVAKSADASRKVLCVVGGGGDGMPLAKAFLQAPLPPDSTGLLVTGPLMPDNARSALRDLARQRPDLKIVEFVTDPTRLLQEADMVIAMGGYNTVCEVLAYEKRALIVPRIQPRSEQLIRATCLANLGLVDVLHPDELSPARLADWMQQRPGRRLRAHEVIDFDGVAGLRRLYGEVMAIKDYDRRIMHAAG